MSPPAATVEDVWRAFPVPATKVPGKIILRATSPDLTGADAVIVSRPSREEQR